MEGKKKKMKTMYSFIPSALNIKGKEKMERDVIILRWCEEMSTTILKSIIKKISPTHMIEAKFRGSLRVTVYANVFLDLFASNYTKHDILSRVRK